MIRTPGRGEDRIESRGELGIAVPEQELDTVSVILEGHQQVACLLGPHSPPDGR